MIEPLLTPEGERVHVLKSHPEAFDAVWRGRKLFEWRSARDREFRRGDFLRLREWIPASRDGEPGSYTGREIVARVPYMLSKGFGLPNGFVVLSIEVVAKTRHSTAALSALTFPPDDQPDPERPS